MALAVLCGGLLGALLLLVAEFTTLYDVQDDHRRRLVKSVSTGSNHSYALVPIALLAALLAFAVWRTGSRPALLAIGVLGRARAADQPRSATSPTPTPRA